MTKAKVHVIDAEPVGEGIVETLEDWLERAKAGEVSSVAIAIVNRDGSASTEWSDAPSQVLLIGAVSRLQWRLNQELDE